MRNLHIFEWFYKDYSSDKNKNPETDIKDCIFKYFYNGINNKK